MAGRRASRSLCSSALTSGVAANSVARRPFLKGSTVVCSEGWVVGCCHGGIK
uniref:Uncharacterized protein n=1 Tax=uncultured marine virus TaxID=186617 RepID=A0A0F7L3D6_9VIRU|nr:hypothetical protein [uncultured marine virus]